MRKIFQCFHRVLSLLPSDDATEAARDLELSSVYLPVSRMSLQHNLVLWDGSTTLTQTCCTLTTTQMDRSIEYQENIQFPYTCDAELPPVWIPDAFDKIFKFILRCLDLNWDLAVYAQCHWKAGYFYLCVYTEADFRNLDWKLITDKDGNLRDFFLCLLNSLCSLHCVDKVAL